MSYAVAGAIGGGLFGGVTSFMSMHATNKSLEAQAKWNTQKFLLDKALSEFAQTNNKLRADEISKQILAEEAEMTREVDAAQAEAVGTETIRRGEGITAGASVDRSIDSIIQAGDKAKADVSNKSESAFMQVQTEARVANSREQIKQIDSFNNMITQNAQLAAQEISGINALLQIGGAVLTGAITGAQLGKAFESTTATDNRSKGAASLATNSASSTAAGASLAPKV